MLNPGKRDAVELAASLASLDVDLTITVGKDADFRDAVVAATAGKAEASVARPESGALAFYALCEFNDDIEPYCLATQVRVLEAGK